MTIPEIVSSYIAAYNSRDADALAACVSQDIVFENVSNNYGSMVVSGKSAFAELAAQAVNLFAERNISIRTAVVFGDKVALEIDWTGVPVADFGAFKAGERVTMRGATFFMIDSGKLSRIVDIS